MRRTLAAATLAAATLSGPALPRALAPSVAHADRRGDHYWSSTYDHDGLAVDVKEITHTSNGKVWFKLAFIDKSDKPMVVDPDRLQLSTPDGRTLGRLKGTFDNLSHGAKSIEPGAASEVSVEYQVGDAPPKVSLGLGGILVGGKPFKGPPLVARLGGPEWTAPSYEHARIHVVLRSVKQDGEKIVVAMGVANESDAPIFVDLDAFRAALPDGTKVSREKGLTDRFKNAKSTVDAKRSAELELTFAIGHASKVAIDLGINEGALGLPPLQLVAE